MAKAKSDALKRLLDRNFGAKNSKTSLISKKKSKSDKKAIKKRRNQIKNLNAGLEASESKTSHRKASKPSDLANEIEALKQEIAKNIDAKVTYVKRASSMETPVGWEGLTPGLAPVGYDPDESDSDDDPY